MKHNVGTLDRALSDGQVNDLRATLPPNLRSLWSMGCRSDIARACGPYNIHKKEKSP